MMTLKEALELVREAHPNDLIWDALEVDGKWYFIHTQGKYFSPDDGSGAGLVVEDGECKLCYDYWKLLFSDQAFSEAYRHRVSIDVDVNKLELIQNEFTKDVKMF